MKLKKMAADWRENAGPGYDGGYVVVYGSEVAGWVQDIERKPSSWLPGCIAVDLQGDTWRAEGGNDYDGADKWVKFTFHSGTN